jgi:hypothetical protein
MNEDYYDVFKKGLEDAMKYNEAVTASLYRTRGILDAFKESVSSNWGKNIDMGIGYDGLHPEVVDMSIYAHEKEGQTRCFTAIAHFTLRFKYSPEGELVSHILAYNKDDVSKFAYGHEFNWFIEGTDLVATLLKFISVPAVTLQLNELGEKPNVE